MGDTSERERSVPMGESVEEVRGKSKKKEVGMGSGMDLSSSFVVRS